jgi:hypothetical protein
MLCSTKSILVRLQQLDATLREELEPLMQSMDAFVLPLHQAMTNLAPFTQKEVDTQKDMLWIQQLLSSLAIPTMDTVDTNMVSVFIVYAQVV